MNADDRALTLRTLHRKFMAKNVGFMMPLFGVLYADNGGCRGPKKKFYSPDNQYGCHDEDVINAILMGGRK